MNKTNEMLLPKIFLAMTYHNNSRLKVTLMFVGFVLFISCGPVDDTAKAGDVVREANNDLKEIKKIYEINENKRDDLKKALLTDNEAAVRQITDDLVKAIAEGSKFGVSAMEKLDQAREMKINSDYADYLKLKSDALSRQLKAFDEYRQAAKKLNDAYDPKNTQAKEEVKAEFKERSDRFQKNMEIAREYSSEANEFAKDVQRKEQGN